MTKIGILQHLYVTVFLMSPSILNCHVTMMMTMMPCHACCSEGNEPLIHVLQDFKLCNCCIGHQDLVVFPPCVITFCKGVLWTHMAVCPCAFSCLNFTKKCPILLVRVSLRVDVNCDRSPNLKIDASLDYGSAESPTRILKAINDCS